jgi:hypothetical protein
MDSFASHSLSMTMQKKQKSKSLNSQKPNVIKLLSYKIDSGKSSNDGNGSEAKKETLLFYNKPIHKARKHDLF